MQYRDLDSPCVLPVTVPVPGAARGEQYVVLELSGAELSLELWSNYKLKQHSTTSLPLTAAPPGSISSLRAEKLSHLAWLVAVITQGVR